MSTRLARGSAGSRSLEGAVHRPIERDRLRVRRGVRPVARRVRAAREREQLEPVRAPATQIAEAG